MYGGTDYFVGCKTYRLKSQIFHSSLAISHPNILTVAMMSLRPAVCLIACNTRSPTNLTDISTLAETAHRSGLGTKLILFGFGSNDSGREFGERANLEELSRQIGALGCLEYPVMNDEAIREIVMNVVRSVDETETKIEKQKKQKKKRCIIA